MILDIFSELQRPGPFAPDHEARMFADALEQAFLASLEGESRLAGFEWAVLAEDAFAER